MLISSEDASLLTAAYEEYERTVSKSDLTVMSQEDFNIADVLESFSTIGMFGDPRAVILRFTDIIKITDEDFQSLCDGIAECVDITVAVFIFYPDKYAKDGKKAKAITGVFEKKGSCVMLLPIVGEKQKKHIADYAETLGCKIDSGAVNLLMEKFPSELILLEREIEKAAALCGYSTITAQIVQNISITVLTADVFSLLTPLLNGKSGLCFQKLSILLQNGEEPIAILAAITGSFIDIYRVKCGMISKVNYTEVFKDFGYKGNNYRLKKAEEFARKLSIEKLSRIINILIKADKELKSMPVDRNALFEKHFFKLVSAL